MEKYYVFSIIILLLSTILPAQNESSNCDPASMHCWDKVYIPGGTMTCTDYTVSFNENYQNLNNWNTHYFAEDYELSRAHNTCEEQLYFAENVVIDNNRCVLKGKYIPNSTWTNSDNITFVRDFTSGMIQTKSGFHFGKYEAIVDDMPGNGWWPAFWVWHHEEIDIMERFYDEFKYGYNIYATNGCSISNQTTTTTSLYGGPHKFGMEITPFKITFFYNDQPLSFVAYRYFNLDGTPLNIDCNQNIPEGTYYLNPKFPNLWRYHEGVNILESTIFKPIINLAVLPRHGLQCCGVNIYCDDPGCDLPCADWGNPVDENGNPVPGRDVETEMVISNVKVKERTYTVCNSIAVRYDDSYCIGDDITVTLESFSNLTQFPLYQVQVNSVTTSSKLSYLGIDLNRHKLNLKALAAGTGTFTINYTDECGIPRSVTRQITIRNTKDCGIDVCDEAKDHECCPENTFYDGANCYYADVPTGYTPLIKNNSFYVSPNCTISTSNNCCPAGYSFDGQDCHSGITFPGGYEGFIYDGRYYVKPECGDIRDCCPSGYQYDGANCYSGVTAPDEYESFIYENVFYVKPNCTVSTANNCCPPGFTFDGVNCHSGIYIPENYEGFILENAFYVKPYCEEESDCCPVGSEFDGANCRFGPVPFGYEGFAYGNRFFVKPNCAISENNNCCPPGYTFDGVNCASDITFPNPFQGFAYNGSFYVKTHCPQDESCCPLNANFDGANCWFLNVPAGYQPFILGNAFYVSPDCRISTSNNCCPPGFSFDGVNCHSGIYFPNDLSGFIYNGSFYTSSYCDELKDDNVEGRGQELQANPNRSGIMSAHLFRIFPNPAQQYVNIGFYDSLEGITTVRVTDNLGRLVDELFLKDVQPQSVLSIPVDNQAPGIYSITLENGSFRGSGRFIKQ